MVEFSRIINFAMIYKRLIIKSIREPVVPNLPKNLVMMQKTVGSITLSSFLFPH